MGALSILYEFIPFRISPVYAIMIILGLAYVPAFLRTGLVMKKVSKHGKSLDVAGTRLQTANCIDNTPEGKQIAALNGCHANGLEAFAYFSVAVLLALVLKVERSDIEEAATAFTVLRTLYTIVYVIPSLNGPLRSVIFGLGIWVCFDLFFRSAQKW